jgi:sugar lactone lactonase YvrE
MNDCVGESQEVSVNFHFSDRPRAAIFLAFLLLAACSGGGSSGPPGTYKISGTVSGLSGSGLILVDNGNDQLSVPSNGSFTFATAVPAGGLYSVSVLTPPASPIQTCRITNGSGSVGTSDVNSVAVICKTAILSLFAGNVNGPGSADGSATAARFGSPQSIATDTSGNVYAVELGNNTIRKISPQGVVTTLAGLALYLGNADGIGAAARFNYPTGIAADAAGILYVGDNSHGNGTIRKVTPAGAVTTLALTSVYVGPVGISLGGFATDSAGNIYVAATNAHAIMEVTPAGNVSTFAGTTGLSGSVDGVGTSALFYYPQDVAIDAAGNLFVADSDNFTIRKITPGGVVSTFAGTAGASGSADGIGPAARFNIPTGIATDLASNVYVVESPDNTIRKITPAGVVTTLAGTAGVQGSADGTGASAQFNGPTGIAADSTGNLYVADYGNAAIRQISPSGIVTTLAGAADIPLHGSADGVGAAARFNDPQGIANDSAGNIYVADTFNYTIRKIRPDGSVTTLAGTPGVRGTADGVGAAAQFCEPVGIAIDSTGNLYVADGEVTAAPQFPNDSCFGNSIRKITPAGVVSTFAGMAGTTGSADGTGSDARFANPRGIAIDEAGNLYVTDTGNYLIRKIMPAGVVTTLAGSPGNSGAVNGIGAAAQFAGPTGIVTDAAGNAYVCDSSNSMIRKVTPAGVVTTFAGTGAVGYADGPGAMAQFAAPQGISIDSVGNLYVSDYLNATIRKITLAGMVSTVVGVPNQAGFAAGLLPGLIGFPGGVAISGTSLYITLYNGVAVVQDVP